MEDQRYVLIAPGQVRKEDGMIGELFEEVEKLVINHGFGIILEGAN